MTAKELRTWCLGMEGAEESFPFSEGVSVFKAANGKIFAISNLDSTPLDVSVKCDPELSEALRSDFESVVPGYHLNKRHWITVVLGGDLPDDRVRDLVEDSFDLVRSKRPRRARSG